MSDLQFALIAAGAIAVAGVWTYNKWQEGAQRKLAEKVFGGGKADLLLGDRVAAAGGKEVGERQEPVIDGAPDVAADGVPPLPEAWADEMADCVVRMDFIQAVPATSLWQAQSTWAGRIGKPLHWLGLDRGLGHWRQLTERDGGRYPVVCACLQIADRRGPVSDSELTLFLDGVKDLAQRFSGLAELPSADQVLIHARAVDDACVAVDMQLGLNVVPADGRSFAGSALRQMAQTGGLQLSEDGLFRPTDDTFALGNMGDPFVLSSLDDVVIQGITLTLDVPCVADSPAAFDRLLALANGLTAGLGGVLVDGQRHALSPEMIGNIRAKIVELQQQMIERRIAPGSVRARRLFS
jgi:hypothetical protein